METRKTEHGIKVISSGSFCDLKKPITLELAACIEAVYMTESMALLKFSTKKERTGN